jgi:ribosomal protein S18 acetylase RimI-like enzyme
MHATAVRTGLATDEAAAINTIVLAFAADPVARWVWPDAQRYAASMGPFARAFGGGAFHHRSAYNTDDYAGVALWLPPGAGPDEDAVAQLIEETVEPSQRDGVYEMMEQMGGSHPGNPHWYLPLIGVDPSQQGRGHGSALLAQALRVCDREHRIAYLESTNPRNLPLYQRFGFEVTRTIKVGTAPAVWPMVRRAR